MLRYALVLAWVLGAGGSASWALYGQDASAFAFMAAVTFLSACGVLTDWAYR